MNPKDSSESGVPPGGHVRFRNRQEAGRQLAARLAHHRGRENVLVLGLARGGVPVAHAVARVLGAPLDVILIRKLGVPSQPELAMGAIASGGVRVLNPQILRHFGDPERMVERVAVAEQLELARREKEYLGGRTPAEVAGKMVILVDDGLATGASMRAAVQALRERKAARVVVAVPVGSPEACEKLKGEADELICLSAPADFAAVGQAYGDFSQTPDEEVRRLLADGKPHAF